MKWRRFLALAAITLASVALALMLTRWAAVSVWAEGLELRTLDWRQQFAAESVQDGEVVLVLFDSAATKEWPYLSPYPRAFLADVIDAVAGAGARVIGLDVYLDRLYPELNRMDGGDDRLRQAMATAGNVVLVAPTEVTDEGPRLVYPDPYFTEVALDVAAADLPTPFETVRDGLVAVKSGGGLEPSVALALYAHSRGLSADSILRSGLNEGFFKLPGMPPQFGRIDPAWLAAERAGSGYAHTFPLRFLGPPSRPGDKGGTFPAYTASDVPVLAPFSPEWFRDKIVLVGTGFHDSDKFRSPFYSQRRPDGTLAGWTYGVEIHANALMNFIQAEYLTPFGRGRELVLLLFAALAVGGVVFWRGAGWGGAAGVLAVLAVASVALLAFQGELRWGPRTLFRLGDSLVWVPVISPLIATVLSYLGSTAYVAIIEGREKRFIRGAFAKYVSPHVVQDIAAKPELLRLGGEKRELTLLFSDLAGFTELSESMDPEHLVSLLNEYLDEMARIVLEEEGTLDKYIGDAIMAFWNAPKEQPDHADRALRCAVRMQRRLAELNRRWLEQGRADGALRVRIGINTGVAIVGNVGGTERFDYSAIGDTVNLAARLEPANKTYGTLVMASELSVRAARFEAYRMRELDYLAVKGKARPVRVYEVIGMADEPVAPELAELVKHYEQGLAAYHRRDWELAERYFRAALDTDPDDGPSRLYLARAQQYMANPPPADWDFVVRRTVK